MELRFNVNDAFILDDTIMEIRDIKRGYYLCEFLEGNEMIIEPILCSYADKNAEQLPF